jgi:hypothetical protein
MHRTLVDLLESAAARYGDSHAIGLRRDDAFGRWASSPATGS